MKKVLAFDIGGTNTRLALINENFEVEKRIDIPTVTGSKEGFIQNCIDLIEKFPLENVVAIGAGVPGVVDIDTGRIVDLPNVGIKDINFGEILSKKFNVPVFIRNDAQIACLGEAYLGAGKTHERVFFITISTGLGGALCVDKKIQDYITEVGHTLFFYKDGYYEFEGLASGSHVNNLANILGIKGIKSTKDMFALLKNNDEQGILLFKEWFKIINQFINLMIDSYCPDVICMTGGVMKAKDYFFKKLQKENRKTNIVECKFSEDAGIMGAGVYALQCAKII